MIHVPDVIREPAPPVQRVSAMDLRPARDAGSYAVPPGLVGGVQRQIFHQQWPRAHETHVSDEYVEQLRQLIETEAAKRLPQSCQPLIVGKKLVRFTVHVAHRPELVEHERLFVQAWPLLPKQHG
ncbi:MAG: hypothetical protein JWM95_5520 [Gemmatimonadetes bacterium]|nr:hypothetical protein [Gemmatimonadota bacterium]